MHCYYIYVFLYYVTSLLSAYEEWNWAFGAEKRALRVVVLFDLRSDEIAFFYILIKCL